MNFNSDVKFVQFDGQRFSEAVVWCKQYWITTKVPWPSLSDFLPITQASKLHHKEIFLSGVNLNIARQIPCGPHILEEPKVTELPIDVHSH